MSDEPKKAVDFVMLDFDTVRALALEDFTAVKSLSAGSRAMEQKWSRAKKSDDAGAQARRDEDMLTVAMDNLDRDFIQGSKCPSEDLAGFLYFQIPRLISSTGLEKLVTNAPFLIGSISHDFIPDDEENQSRLLELTQFIEESMELPRSPTDKASSNLAHRIDAKKMIKQALVPDHEIESWMGEKKLSNEGLAAFALISYSVVLGPTKVPFWATDINLVFDTWKQPHLRSHWRTHVTLPDAPITEIWAEIPKFPTNLFSDYGIEKFSYDQLKRSIEFDEPDEPEAES